jgi:hypothetical protein
MLLLDPSRSRDRRIWDSTTANMSFDVLVPESLGEWKGDAAITEQAVRHSPMPPARRQREPMRSPQEGSNPAGSSPHRHASNALVTFSASLRAGQLAASQSARGGKEGPRLIFRFVSVMTCQETRLKPTCLLPRRRKSAGTGRVASLSFRIRSQGRPKMGPRIREPYFRNSPTSLSAPNRADCFQPDVRR